MATNPFDSYIPNFKTIDGQEDPIAQLQTYIEEKEAPLLINFLPDFSNEKKTIDIDYPFSEQERKGGLGKTVALDRSRYYFYQYHIDPTFDYGDKDKRKKVKEHLPFIDLAEQYMTRKDILFKVVHCLCKIEPKLEKEVFDEFTKRFPLKGKEQEDNPEYDPSFVAERLFDSATQELKNGIYTEGGTFALFFDSFDAQYLGDSHTPLRLWLLETLFPYLVIKLKIKVFVSGREQVISKPIDDRKMLKKCEVISFDNTNLIKYFEGYTERAVRLKDKIDSIDSIKWQSIVKELRQNINYIQDCTEGKPIFIDYFADLALSQCVIKKEFADLKSLIAHIKEETKFINFDSGTSGKDKKIIGFKTYLIERLHLQGNDDDENSRAIAKAILVLSCVKHGLSADELYDLVSNVEDTSVFKDKKFVNTFFETIFSNDKLPYVKNIETSNSSRRLLHDEVVELVQQYYYKANDPVHSTRNGYIGYLLRMYERLLKNLSEFNYKYPKLLSEYLEYALTFYGKEKEREAINRLLFEFSYYLDRHPDLCSRILGKGLNYYQRKRLNFHEKNPQTLTFSEDFFTLSKLRLREADYCLSERNKRKKHKDDKEEWLARIEASVKEIRDCAKELHIQLTTNQREALEARCLVVEGEALFWDVKWEEGKEKVFQARQKFYFTGDAYGVIWSEHLLGFEAQRSGQFKRAMQYHIDTIDAALDSYMLLAKEAEKNQRYDIVDYGLLYRLRFLIRTINRANGNWGINRRFRGKILEAITLLEGNLDIAQIVGTREVARNRSNIAQLYAIRGIEWQFTPNFDKANTHAQNINDSVIIRRNSATRTTLIYKQLGLNALSNYRYRIIDDPQLIQKEVSEHVIRVIKNLLEGDSIYNRHYLQTHPIKDTEKSIVKATLNYLNLSMPKQQGLLSLEIKESHFRAIDNLADLLKGETYKEKLAGLNREVADMYYQYGKLVLSSNTGIENMDYIEEAKLAFQNAQFVAKESTFKYLEIEAIESLYRLSYLSGNKQNEEHYSKLFNNEIKTLDEKEYGIYNDLLAKFCLTKADIQLDKAILENDEKFAKVFEASLTHFGEALHYAHQHNQERFILILNAFSESLRYVFNKKKDIVSHIELTTKSFFNRSEPKDGLIEKNDNTFTLHLKTFLEALRLEVLNVYDKNKIKSVRSGILELGERGKFLKAADANACLIALTKRQDDQKPQLFTLYFQQFYYFLSSSQQRRAERLLETIEKELIIDKGIDTTKMHPLSNDGAIYLVMRGFADYRKDEFWNMEKFLFGELRGFREEFGMIKLQQAALKLINAINYLNDNAFEAHKVYKRIITEGLFRLGELYILMELDYSKEEDMRQAILDFDNFRKGDITKRLLPLVRKKAFSNGKKYDDTPAIFCLNMAYYLAISINDTHRVIDTLQSIANARYFRGETIVSAQYNAFECENNVSIIVDHIHNKARQYDKNLLVKRTKKGTEKDELREYCYPIVISKTYLVEGNVYFSLLFEYASENKFALRETWESAIEQNNWDKIGEMKGTLHKMLWNYLSGLDLLTDPNKPYENYHFNNMIYEINRRILCIQKPDLVRAALECLKIMWDSFTRLNKKPSIWESMEFSLKTHELALAAKGIFDNKKNNK